MFHSRSRLIALASLTAIVGCRGSQPTVDLTVEAQAVRDASMAWLATMQAKDFAAAASYFAPDGMKYLERQDPLMGPAAIQAYFEADAAKMPNASVSWTTDNVVVAASGDMAVETGNWVYSDAGKEIDLGKFVTNWRKVDGAWKVSTDIGVSTVPVVADSVAVKKPATNQ